jgi:thiamine pyrophosphate-dependent acetolactate synthase large subunit-like protein
LSQLWQVNALSGFCSDRDFLASRESMTIILIHADRKTSMIRPSDYLTKLPENERVLVSPRREPKAFIAETYGRLMGKPGICISVLAPGVLNFCFISKALPRAAI